MERKLRITNNNASVHNGLHGIPLFLLLVQEANRVISKVSYNRPSDKYKLNAWQTVDSS